MRVLYLHGIVAITLAYATAASARAQSVDPKVVRYGEHLSSECASCHRRDGTDNGIPSIIGMKSAEFAETIKFYQTGARSNAAMVSVAQSLDDDQIKALAAFYEQLPVPKKKR